MLKIGDFVTQYSSGYWQIIDIKQKISDLDYSNDKVNIKKGEVIGEWIILKKAFTQKMKPLIDFDYCDSAWIKPVSEETLNKIIKYFEKNSKFKEKFENAKIELRYSITNCWFNMPLELEEEFFKKLNIFLEENRLFLMNLFWNYFDDYKKYVSNPPANYLLNFLGLPWNIDENGNKLYEGCEMRKMK